MGKLDTLKQLQPLGLRLGFSVPPIVTEFEKDVLYAVRSNDSEEDREEASLAGQFKTMLFVPGEKAFSAVKKVLEEADGAFVQEMIVDPDWSFVFIFDGKDFVCSVNNGLCSALTDGSITGSIWKNGEFALLDQRLSEVYSAKEKSPIVIEDENPKFSSDALQRLERIARALLEECGYPVNVEGSVKGNEVFLLQCRPFSAANKKKRKDKK